MDGVIFLPIFKEENVSLKTPFLISEIYQAVMRSMVIKALVPMVSMSHSLGGFDPFLGRRYGLCFSSFIILVLPSWFLLLFFYFDL